MGLMENSWALLFLVSLLTLAFITKIIYNNKQQPKRKLPPGPKPWPIIGNLNLVGSIPHQSLHNLSQKYGEMMLLKFGKFPVVVASSPEMAKQILKVHDAVFASRPALAAGKHLSYNYSGMLLSPYGPYWRQARKIFHTKVFKAERLDLSKQIRVEEGRRFLSRLHSLSGKPVVLREQLLHLTLSTISRMVFGNKLYFSEREQVHESFFKLDEYQEMLDEWFLLAAVKNNIGDWVPWLSFLDLQGYVKRMKVLCKKLDMFYDNVIDGRVEEKEEGLDMVDLLLEEAENPNLEVPLTRDHIKGLLNDLLGGATDTSAASIEWAMLEILKHPRILKKAKDELDVVIGRNRWVEEKDFCQLPYLEAIIMESFRLHPISSLLAPHYATEDCNVSGYDIAKGTMILINTWSIGRDPKTWDEPHEFLPERFIGVNKIDMMGSNFALLPFGSGRRRCPGYHLALEVVRTTLANLLHGFEMKLVGDHICMDEVYGLAVQPKHPLSIVMEPTLPPYLY